MGKRDGSPSPMRERGGGGVCGFFIEALTSAHHALCCSRGGPALGPLGVSLGVDGGGPGVVHHLSE